MDALIREKQINERLEGKCMPADVDKKIRIKILKSGPYLVTGSIPLSEKIIVLKRKNYEYHHKRDFPLFDEYELCRCGRTKKSPYCDGTHERSGFIGKETASRDDYARRAQLLEGPDLDLMDDNRCAYARFCQRNAGSVWDLTENSDDPHARSEAIIGACDCPTGRLVALDKDGNPFELRFEPAIEILQDAENRVSGPLYVKGSIPIESSKGFVYEARNRVALCRCGQSGNKPYCDATHVSAEYRDRE